MREQHLSLSFDSDTKRNITARVSNIERKIKEIYGKMIPLAKSARSRTG